jgi:hypothetical protein
MPNKKSMQDEFFKHQPQHGSVDVKCMILFGYTSEFYVLVYLVKQPI